MIVRCRDICVRNYSVHRFANFTVEHNPFSSSNLVSIPFFLGCLEKHLESKPSNDVFLNFFSFLVDYPDKSLFLELKYPLLATIVRSYDNRMISCPSSNKIDIILSVLAIEQLISFGLWDKIPDFIKWVRIYYGFSSDMTAQKSDEIETRLAACFYLSYPFKIPSQNSFRIRLLIARKYLFSTYLLFMTKNSVQEMLTFLLRDRLDLHFAMQIIHEIRQKNIPLWIKGHHDCWLEWFVIETICSRFKYDTIVRKNSFLVNLHAFFAYLFLPTKELKSDQTPGIPKFLALPQYLSTIQPWIGLAYKNFLGPITVSSILDAIHKEWILPSRDSYTLNSIKVPFHLGSAVRPNREILFLMLLLITILNFPNPNRIDSYLKQLFCITSSVLKDVQVQPKIEYFYLFPILSSSCNLILREAIRTVELIRYKIYEMETVELYSRIPLAFLSYDYLCFSLVRYLAMRMEWIRVISLFRRMLHEYSNAEIESFLSIKDTKVLICTAAVSTNSLDICCKLLQEMTSIMSSSLIPMEIYRLLKTQTTINQFISDDRIISTETVEIDLSLDAGDSLVVKKTIDDLHLPPKILMGSIRKELIQTSTISHQFRNRIELPSCWNRFKRNFVCNVRNAYLRENL